MGGDGERWNDGLGGMTVELGGFWRKPTEFGERFEEVPRGLRHDLDVRVSSGGESKQFC
jgi:hypothetical protein